MPYLPDLIAGGLPEDALLSIVPPNASWPDPKGLGKVPARMDQKTGLWKGLDHWQHGEPAAHREISDQFGCNFGVLAGQAHRDRHGEIFIGIGIDGDLIDDAGGIAKAWRPRLLAAIAAKFDMPDLLVRHTRDVRFMVIAGIEPGGNVGGKTRITIWHELPGGSRTELGTIEILTKGSQFIVAGVHHSGNQIRWSRLTTPHLEYAVPVIEEGIPLFPGFDALCTAFTDALDCFETEGFHYKAEQIRAEREVGPDISPEYLAPPDARTFCALVDRIPNPPDCSRDTYCDMWFATVGCRNALIALDRATPEQLFEMERAVLDWCGRWKPPPPHKALTREEEIYKATHDFYEYRSISIGWRKIQEIATRLGVSGVAYEAAAEDFKDSVEDAPAEPMSQHDALEAARLTDNTRVPLDPAPPPPETSFLILPPEPRSLNVQLADSQIADFITRELMGNAIWVPDEDRWIVYSKRRGWNGTPTAKNKLRALIDNLLWTYTARFADAAEGTSEIWKPAERAQVLSVARINAMESMLKDRLAKPRAEINQASFVLQTPAGAYSLKDGSKIPVLEQKQLLDTRCTTVAPKQGPTPLWDELLFNLSDGNAAVMDYLKHYFGYAILGEPRARIFLYIHGTSGNGKSALVRIAKGILGNYAVILNNEIFLQSGKDKHKTSLYRIRDALFAFALEMPRGERWNSELLKNLTGMDEIQARNMSQNEQSFIANSAILLSGNDIPKFDHIDQSIVARLRMTGTNRKPAVEDPLFDERVIREEGPAILYQLMEYAQRVYQAGIKLPPVPAAMVRKAGDVLSEQDPFFAWHSTELDTTPKAGTSRVTIAALKERYEAFLRRRKNDNADDDDDDFGTSSVSTPDFQKKLRNMGLRLEDSNGDRIRIKGQPAVEGCALKIDIANRESA